MNFPERLTSITELAHSLAAAALKPGSRAVDCTAGNGHDTLFLLEQTAPDGFVYAFDIQQQALQNTGNRLKKAGIPSTRYALVHDCHSRIDQYVQPGVAACMFNLGYLPGAPHDITTIPQKVISAIEKVTDLLLPAGIITVVMYRGHKAGRHESRAILDYTSTLDEKMYRVMHIKNLNTSRPSPSILVIQKL